MEIKQTQINHLIKTLAEQLRKAESLDVQTQQKQLAAACKAASKTVAQLEKLGMHYSTAYDKAVELNTAIAA